MVDQAMRSTCITYSLFFYFIPFSFNYFFVFNFHFTDRGIIKCLNYLGKKSLNYYLPFSPHTYTYKLTSIHPSLHGPYGLTSPVPYLKAL